MAPAGNRASGEELVVGGVACVVAAVVIFGASQTSKAVPIIAGSVAILVALFTWYATDKRQTKAIAAHEREQERAFRAERERLAAQLRHDRVLADVADLRAVLEEALDSVDEWRAHAEAWGAAAAGSSEERDARRAMDRDLNAMHKVTNRLRVRLGEFDPILLAWRELAVEGAGDYHDAARASDEAARVVAAARMNVAYRQLVELAKERVGSRTQ